MAKDKREPKPKRQRKGQHKPKAANAGATLNEFNEDELYDRFPSGVDTGFSPETGFNSIVLLNDAELFTEEARRHPVIEAFLNAPFGVYYSQWKSSQRETEYFLHKPHLALRGKVEGIEGLVDRMPDDPRICTLVMNHENTLAMRIARSLLIEDGKDAAQLVHKEPSDG